MTIGEWESSGEVRARIEARESKGQIESLESENRKLKFKVEQQRKEIESLKKQLTRKTNLHNKTAKRLTENRKMLRSKKEVLKSQRTLIETQDNVIDNLKRDMEIVRRNANDLRVELENSQSNVRGWKKQFEMLEDKVKSTEKGKIGNWKVSAKYWRTKHSKLLEMLTKAEELQRKTSNNLRVARAMQKHQSDQKVFFTRLNRAAGNRIYRLEKELEVERNRLADAVKQIKRLESENEDGKHFKRLESAYDDLFERYKHAGAQIEHERLLTQYKDDYVNELELTRSHLRQEVENYKEDVLHVVRVSRKG